MSEPLEIRGKCKYCKEDIVPNASVCKTCGSHQTFWRNWSLFVGSITGGIALVLSGLLYFGDCIEKLQRNLTWEDSVRLVALHHVDGNRGFSSMAIQNDGDGQVFVTGVTISTGRGKPNLSIVVNASIDAETFYPIEIGDLGPTFEEMDGYIANKTGIPTLEMLGSATNDLNEKSACFVRRFFNQNSYDVQRMSVLFSKTGSRLILEPVDLTVHFISARDGRSLEEKSKGQATFSRRKTDECLAITLD